MRLWSKWTKNEKIPKANELIGWRVRIGGVHASPTWPELRTRRSGMTCVIRNQKKKKKKTLGLMLEVQKFPNIKEFHTFSIKGNMSWTTPIRSNLKHEQLPRILKRRGRSRSELPNSLSWTTYFTKGGSPSPTLGASSRTK